MSAVKLVFSIKTVIVLPIISESVFRRPRQCLLVYGICAFRLIFGSSFDLSPRLTLSTHTQLASQKFGRTLDLCLWNNENKFLTGAISVPRAIHYRFYCQTTSTINRECHGSIPDSAISHVITFLTIIDSKDHLKSKEVLWSWQSQW